MSLSESLAKIEYENYLINQKTIIDSNLLCINEILTSKLNIKKKSKFIKNLGNYLLKFYI